MLVFIEEIGARLSEVTIEGFEGRTNSEKLQRD